MNILTKPILLIAPWIFLLFAAGFIWTLLLGVLVFLAVGFLNFASTPTGLGSGVSRYF